jgi:hypothetical protein
MKFLLLLFAVCMYSCSNKPTEKGPTSVMTNATKITINASSGIVLEVEEVVIKDHEYLMVATSSIGGYSFFDLEHNPDCKNHK